MEQDHQPGQLSHRSDWDSKPATTLSDCNHMKTSGKGLPSLAHELSELSLSSVIKVKNNQESLDINKLF